MLLVNYTIVNIAEGKLKVNLPATFVNASATGSRDPKRHVVARERNETFRGFKIDLDKLDVYDTTPRSGMGVPRKTKLNMWISTGEGI